MTYYDEISKGYAELHREEQLKKIAVIKKNLRIDPGDKLLDVGCGPYFGDWGCEVYGIDPSEKLVEIASQKIKAAVGIAEELPYADESFDVVVSVTAAQNFSDLHKGISEMKRVGKSRFGITILKKSEKADEFIRLMMEAFREIEFFEEEKDIIAIADS